MTDERSELYARARAASCDLLGLDPAELTSIQALQVDLTTILRLVIDDMQAEVVAGRTVDINKLTNATDALMKLLPVKSLAPPARQPGELSAKERILEMVRGRIEADKVEEEREVDRLRAKVAELEGEIARLAAGPKLLPARGVEVMPEAEQPQPSSPPPQPQPPQVCSGDEAKRRMAVVNSDRSAYTQQGLRPATHDEPWRPYVDDLGIRTPDPFRRAW